MRASMLAVALGLALLLPAASALADGPSPVIVPAAPAPTAEGHLKEGLDYQKKRDFRRAASAYQAAIRLREAFPEAWNGLGYALRQQGKLPEALKAYERALALRPDYAEALEYLGEAYVKLGRLDDARRVLARLEPLDQEEAHKLRAAIAGVRP